MALAYLKRWAKRLTCTVIAAYLAFFSREVPWLPKLIVIGIAIGTLIAGKMLSDTISTDVPGRILSLASIIVAIATMHKLTPPKLMSGFRSRADGPVIQSYVSAYFECLAVIAVLSILFVTWWAVTE
ncbi:hypothetical protein Amn_41270 [Aminobacter sp. Y103A]|uniref:hypothetical protein n=1 Tax=Aminobacter sp. Y103A TaxID=1870862 RepID=UPI0025734898|nr:hypothetical protein [Aminobacter sp. SS-2016]WMC95675.1 hypothetical protein RAR13_20170 [Aminobacter aminovorans]BBD39247.1 hypothetical protein Amn_41270 [Aminobacter sp. SS-2016]